MRRTKEFILKPGVRKRKRKEKQAKANKCYLCLLLPLSLSFLFSLVTLLSVYDSNTIVLLLQVIVTLL